MAVESLPLVLVGAENQTSVGEKTTDPQTTTNDEVVLAGSEIDAREWDYLIVVIRNVGGGGHAATVRLDKAWKSDYSDHVQEESQNVADGNQVQYLQGPFLGDNLMNAPYYRITIESQVDDDHTDVEAYFLGKKTGV